MVKKSLLAACCCLSASAAHAHVVFDSQTAKAGEFHVAGLRIFHGCDGSPTNTVRLSIPDGVTRVRPRELEGWTVAVEMKTLETPIMLHGFEVTETVDAVVWSGGSIQDFAYQEFETHMMMPDAAGDALSFAVTQLCDEGRLDWDEKALNEEDFRTMESPAPFITLE